MNSLKISLGLAFLIAGTMACTGSNSSSGSSPVTSFGSTDGTQGGPCQESIIADSNRVAEACASGDQERCNRSAQDFASRYPNVDCTYDDGHGTVHLATGDNAGINTSAPTNAEDICSQRAHDMMRILNEAQSAESEHLKYPGNMASAAASLRQEMYAFDVKYPRANCPGQPTKDQFDQEIERGIHDIDSGH